MWLVSQLFERQHPHLGNPLEEEYQALFHGDSCKLYRLRLKVRGGKKFLREKES
jgi:hypothetical protein